MSFVIAFGYWRYYAGVNRFTWRPCVGRDAGDHWTVGVSFEYYTDASVELGVEDFFPLTEDWLNT